MYIWLEERGGKCKTAGKGQIQYCRLEGQFERPFLQRTMAQNRLPSGNIVDSVTHLNILNNLKTNCVDLFSHLHEEASDPIWPKKK